ncbi:hypothetical protein ACFYN9_12895 [Streptomyces collinus]
MRKVTVQGVKASAVNTWVLVTGTWRPTGEPKDSYTDTAPDIARS